MNAPRPAFWLLLASLFWAALASVPTAARDIAFPPLTGRIVDGANLLDSAQEAEITALLEALDARSSDQLVVVTLPSLEGMDIADYGYRLGRRWGIGQSATDNGVLLIVAPNERKVRIEVGRGLEGVMPDTIAFLIVSESILPRFRTGDYPGGIRQGVEDISAVLLGEGGEWERRAAQRPPATSDDANSVDTIIFLIMLGFFAFSMYRSISNRGRMQDVILDESGRRVTRRGGLASGIPPIIFRPGGGRRGGGFGGGGFRGGGGGFGGGGAAGGW